MHVYVFLYLLTFSYYLCSKKKVNNIFFIRINHVFVAIQWTLVIFTSQSLIREISLGVNKLFDDFFYYWSNFFFRGTVHLDQSDVPGVTPSLLSSVMGGHSSKRISFDVATEVQREIIMRYFGKYLKNKGSTYVAIYPMLLFIRCFFTI